VWVTLDPDVKYQIRARDGGFLRSRTYLDRAIVLAKKNLVPDSPLLIPVYNHATLNWPTHDQVEEILALVQLWANIDLPILVLRDAILDYMAVV
jgi:hypothetical protein